MTLLLVALGGAAATYVFFSVTLCIAATFAGMGAVRAVNTLTVR